MKRTIRLAVALSMAVASLQIHAKDIKQVSYRGRAGGGCAPCTPEGCGEACCPPPACGEGCGEVCPIAPSGCGEACVSNTTPKAPRRLAAKPALKATPAPMQESEEGVYRLTSASVAGSACDAGACNTTSCESTGVQGSSACYHGNVCYDEQGSYPYHGYYENPFGQALRHLFCEKAFPDAGWAPPAHTPIHQVGGQFQSYWPSAWYGNPGGGYGPGAPMVYQPTDTTQLGYTYAHVPAWQRNPGIIPRVPNPEDFHARRCPQPCGYGLCPGSCQQGSACNCGHGYSGSTQWAPQHGGSCPSGSCYGASAKQPRQPQTRQVAAAKPASMPMTPVEQRLRAMTARQRRGLIWPSLVASNSAPAPQPESRPSTAPRTSSTPVRTVSRQVATSSTSQRTVSPLATAAPRPAAQQQRPAPPRQTQRRQTPRPQLPPQRTDGQLRLNPMLNALFK